MIKWMLSVVGRQCDHIIMQYFLPKLLRLGGTTPSCSKCCKSLQQGGMSKPIQLDLVKNIPDIVTLWVGVTLMVT